ncbi:MAG: cell filamentation protein [Bacteroidales bacterium]|nr:cell filamentation protein [Bacteroidales bacterium]
MRAYIFGGLFDSGGKIDKRDYLGAMIASQNDSSQVRELLKGALTDCVDDREIFMKGVDYSYYYEQED